MTKPLVKALRPRRLSRFDPPAKPKREPTKRQHVPQEIRSSVRKLLLLKEDLRWWCAHLRVERAELLEVKPRKRRDSVRIREIEMLLDAAEGCIEQLRNDRIGAMFGIAQNTVSTIARKSYLITGDQHRVGN